MATKTFKIGEYAKGGVITIEIHGKVIQVIGKDWDTSKGWSKGSDQSNAKPFVGGTATAMTTDRDVERKLDNFLCDLTTSYYAGQIMDWIKTKVKFEREW